MDRTVITLKKSVKDVFNRKALQRNAGFPRALNLAPELISFMLAEPLLDDTEEKHRRVQYCGFDSSVLCSNSPAYYKVRDAMFVAHRIECSIGLAPNFFTADIHFFEEGKRREFNFHLECGVSRYAPIITRICYVLHR